MSNPDLTTMILETQYSAFKNNTVYTGSQSISGTVTAGTTIKTYTVPLSTVPDMVDIVFNGAADSGGTDPRPASGWFKQGAVYVPGTDIPSGYNNYPTQWRLYGSITGSTLTISAVWVQQFVASLALATTNFSYRVIDYSVF